RQPHSFPTRRSSDLRAGCDAEHHSVEMQGAALPRAMGTMYWPDARTLLRMPAMRTTTSSWLRLGGAMLITAATAFGAAGQAALGDRKSTRLNSSHQI